MHSITDTPSTVYYRLVTRIGVFEIEPGWVHFHNRSTRTRVKVDPAREQRWVEYLKREDAKRSLR